MGRKFVGESEPVGSGTAPTLGRHCRLRRSSIGGARCEPNFSATHTFRNSAVERTERAPTRCCVRRFEFVRPSLFVLSYFSSFHGCFGSLTISIRLSLPAKNSCYTRRSDVHVACDAQSVSLCSSASESVPILQCFLMRKTFTC